MIDRIDNTMMTKQQLADSNTKQRKPLVIKPLRPRQSRTGHGFANEDDFRTSNWKSLKEAIDAIQDERAVSTSLEQLYRSVEDVCVQNNSAWLYEKLKKECDMHSLRILGALMTVSEQCDGSMEKVEEEQVLEVVGKHWDKYCAQLILIRHIFLYLDRTHVLTKSDYRSIFDMGLFYFREHLGKEFKQVKEMIVQGIMAVVDAERSGDAVRRDLLKNLVRMLALLGLYDAEFMPVFLERTKAFYTEEARRTITSVSLSDFVDYVERRLAEEFNRCNATLEPITRIPLVQTVESCIIQPHVGYMLEHGFKKLMDDDQLDTMKKLFDVMGRVKAHSALCAAFKSHLKDVGSSIVNDQEKDDEMIKEIIVLKRRVDQMLTHCFPSIIFQDAMKDGFSYFVNMRSNRPAELLAKHMDSILKGGGRTLGSGSKGGQAAEDDVEAALDTCLAIFRFIQGKDAFEAFYKKDLAKRLLFNRSFSIDIEKSAISKLKAECGAHYTSKLEGMFKDVELSKDIMSSFKSSSTSMGNLSLVCPGTDINVQVLTSGLWPTYPLLECNFPESLSSGLEVFKNHYLEKYSGRKLIWLHSLGTCIMKVRFSSGVKELAVSFFQSAVLMAFEESDMLSYKDIEVATGIESEELRRTLQSLACGKERVLLKEPKGKDVNDSDVFTFNLGYTSKQYRVKINAIQMKESVDESRKTNEMVMQDRQHQIDAAIVRIMKTRKTLGHKLLMNELMTQLRFPVVASDIKKRVESLIDREYMERDPSDAQIYNYLA